MNPALQLHMNEPSVSAHVALPSQGVSVKHSLISAQNNSDYFPIHFKLLKLLLVQMTPFPANPEMQMHA